MTAGKPLVEKCFQVNCGILAAGVIRQRPTGTCFSRRQQLGAGDHGFALRSQKSAH